VFDLLIIEEVIDPATTQQRADISPFVKPRVGRLEAVMVRQKKRRRPLERASCPLKLG